MIVLDASVLIAHLESTDAHHDRASELLFAVADQPLAASTLTLAEALVGPAKANQLSRATTALRQLDIATIALTDEAPQRLATLRVATALKMPDCCVLLAAESARAGVATFDDRLADAASRLGLPVRTG